MPHTLYKSNQYADAVRDLYDKVPKSVFAALAVSYCTSGGDHFENLEANLLREWWILHDQGIVPQKPPKSRPPEEEVA